MAMPSVAFSATTRYRSSLSRNVSSRPASGNRGRFVRIVIHLVHDGWIACLSLLLPLPTMAAVEEELGGIRPEGEATPVSPQAGTIRLV